MWCRRETDDLAGFQTAFDEMNRQRGLIPELTTAKTLFSTIEETASS